MHDQFTINFSSNAYLNAYKSNTLASFKTILSSPLELEGSWEVGVTEMTYPRQTYNIRDSCFDFFHHGKKSWVEECEIGKGIYHSVDDLLEELIRAIHRKRCVWNKEKLHRYISWKVDEQGKLELNNSFTTKFANVSPDLFHFLGSQQEPSPWQLPPSIHDSPGDFPVDIHHWHQVYVYGDFIEQQVVGNSRAPLLNSFLLFNTQHMPPKEVGEKPGGVLGYGACSFITFSNPIFKVSKTTSIDLLIELRTDTGDLVPFVGVGRTTVTLLFRKIT